MNKLIKVFMRLIIIISIIFFLIITYQSLFYLKDANYLLKTVNKYYIVLWLFSLFLFLLIAIINRLIDKSYAKKLKIVKIILLVLLLFGQIVIIKAINPVQITDSYIVNDQAISIAEGLEKKVDVVANSYFSKYSNNNGCLVLTIYIAKFLKIMKIDYTMGFTIFNTIMIDLGILFTYLIGKKVKNDRFATKLLMFSVLNPLNYLLIHWTYTVTYSIPFMLLLVYLALILKDEKIAVIPRIIYSVCFAICLVFGYYIRPTIVIPLVAIIMCGLIYLLLKKGQLKKLIISSSIIVIFSIISFFSISNFNKQYVDNGNNTFPVTHWIMMGLHGRGTVTNEDNNFTDSFPTHEAKKEATIKEIKRSLESYGFFGFLKHTLIKIPVTWSYGEANYVIRLQQDTKQNSIYRFIVAEKRDLCILYCQAFRIVTLVLCMLGLINQLKNNKFNYSFFNILIIFGAILFYIIWEAKSAYSVPFLPFLFILSSYGFSLTNKISVDKKYIRIAFVLVIATTMLTQLFLYKSFTKKSIIINDYSIRLTNVNKSSYLNSINKNKSFVKQEFTPKKKFNKLSLGIIKNADDPTINYLITVGNSNKVIKQMNINSADIKKDYINISVDAKETIPNAKHYIEIKPDSNNKKRKDTISFGYRKYKNIKYYDGKLTINDELKNGNLFMSVYKTRKEAYVSKKTYLLLSLIIIVSELYMYFLYMKHFSKGDIVDK